MNRGRTFTIRSIADLVDGILRSRFARQPDLDFGYQQVLLIVLAAGLLYGGVMGTYACVAGHRSLDEQLLQMIYSAVNVPLLLSISTLVGLPSFFVLNTLFGLRDDFGKVIRAIVSVQAGLTLILASFAPFTLFFYFCCNQSTVAYKMAILFNAMMFGLASVSAQLLLRVYYRPLIKRNRIHGRMLWVWIGLYAFIGIQCSWILRPFIGDYRVDVAFLRKDKFGNAYIQIWDMVGEVIWQSLGY